MKDTITKIGLCLLILCIAGQGCEKDNLFDSNIFGEWQFLYSIGGIVGTSYPNEGHTYTLEFNEDSILIEKDNNVIMFETEFSVSYDTLTYTRGALLNYKIDISKDTLKLARIPQGTSSYYKRIRH